MTQKNFENRYFQLNSIKNSSVSVDTQKKGVKIHLISLEFISNTKSINIFYLSYSAGFACSEMKTENFIFSLTLRFVEI